MSSVVRVVVSCTDRKRLRPQPDLQLRGYADDLPARASAWIARLEDPRGPRVAAAELYQGEHWRVAQQLAGATDAGLVVELWIASAGYGLIRTDELVEPYAATFATRAEDSITRPASPSEPSVDASYWWRRLSDRKRTDDAPTTLASLAAADPSAPLVVALSEAYVRAVRKDLAHAAAVLDDPSQLLLISGGSSDVSLEEFRVPTDARFLHLLGGTRLSLNARVAKHIFERAHEHSWDGLEVRRLLAEDLAQQPDLVRYERRRLSDDEVKAFIRAELAKGATTSCSALLRYLRDRNWACEQKRFGLLYASVLEGAAS